MYDTLFIHHIYIVRYLSPTSNSLGEPVYSDSQYIDGGSSVPSVPYLIPARIESWNANIQYRDSNIRPINENVVYIPPEYDLVLPKDRIYRDDGTFIGIVKGVNTAVMGVSTDIDHFELTFENP